MSCVSQEHGIHVVRCNRDGADAVRAASALVREAGGTPCRLTTLDCASSQRTLRQALLPVLRAACVPDPEARLDALDLG